MRYAIGTKVKLKLDGDTIPKYYYEDDGIPEEEIKHGGTIVSNKGKGHGVITYIHKDKYVVRYTDYSDKIVKLGFKEESFIVELKQEKYAIY